MMKVPAIKRNITAMTATISSIAGLVRVFRIVKIRWPLPEVSRNMYSAFRLWPMNARARHACWLSVKSVSSRPDSKSSCTSRRSPALRAKKARSRNSTSPRKPRGCQRASRSSSLAASSASSSLWARHFLQCSAHHQARLTTSRRRPARMTDHISGRSATEFPPTSGCEARPQMEIADKSTSWNANDMAYTGKMSSCQAQ
mmetsp:Transcript_83864/g.237864  ORF Transcript_83864/g.237864 Transcript_83864/m.237864 type:complete len:200 (-) Transcript_83864:636-1235(-)